jgi:hypothetical protein
MKFSLIPDWRKSWRFSSMWGAGALALLSFLQTDAPAMLLSLLLDMQVSVLPLAQPLIPDKAWPWVTLGLAVAIAVLRVIYQPKLHEPPHFPPEGEGQ